MSAPKAGAVVFAKNIARVAKFYEEIVPLTVRHAAVDHVVLESGDFQLVVHGVPAHIANTIEISDPPVLRSETPIKLVFSIPSMADARAKAHALGGALSPEGSEWRTSTFRACDGHDPEGNVVQFREHAR